MRRVILLFLLGVLLPACCTTPQATRVATRPKTTFSSFDPVNASDRRYGRDEIHCKDVDLDMFLRLYQETSGRTVIRASGVPSVTFSFRNQQPVTVVELLRLFDTVLAAKGVAMVLVGDDAVKALPEAAAMREPGPIINLPIEELPESGSFMVRAVPLKRVKAVELVPLLLTLASSPHSVVAGQDANLLVLRDYSANVRAMLRVIAEIERAGK